MSGIWAPGSLLKIPVTGEKTPSVTIHSVTDPTLDTKLPPIEGEATSSGLNIFLPAQMDAGPYYFRLTDNDQTIVPGSIDIEPDKIKLIAVYPATAYRGEKNKFDFDIVGENFSPNAKNDDVTIEGQGSIVRNWGGNAKSDCAGKDACLWVDKNGRVMHMVGYRPETQQGIVNVGIRVGNVAPADKQQLVLARLSGTVVFILTAAITGLLFWLVRSVVFSGLANKKVGPKRQQKTLNAFQIFIYDPQSKSYSLSKLQLFFFSGTFIFGYIYVLLSRWLVQWQFSLPDVPNTIAGLLGISGGTTIFSAGLTAARGSKGAGSQFPTGADLISTGGVVVPERFQFFVWTIIACGGFLALLLGQDPAKVSNFPDLPAGLLYVMGVSAGGYLGGKAARNPGPVLELVDVEFELVSDANTAPQPVSSPSEIAPTLIVQGQNLASNGRFFVDGDELGIASVADRNNYEGVPLRLVTPIPQIPAAYTNFCTGLRITVVDSGIANKIKEGCHTFKIVNPDGQFAELSFPSAEAAPSASSP